MTFRSSVLFARLFPGMLAWLLLLPSSASAQTTIPEQLCDPADTDCRQILVNTIRNERVGIDVAFWFMEDGWYADELIRKFQVDRVPVRILVDSRANVDYPRNGPILDRLRDAGIPMRERFGFGILHWKMMLFSGQNLVQFSGANYSPDAWLPLAEPDYTNYTDEAIIFSRKASIVGSFRRKYDDLWTDTSRFRDYANVTDANRVRVHTAFDSFTIDPELNFAGPPPAEGYANRAIGRYNAESGAQRQIDVIMYRITDDRHVDALIAAWQRGVPIRLISEPAQYRNRPELKFRHIRHSYNIDRMHMAGIPIRHRTHAGLNHQKSILLYGQNLTIFGSSNWTTSSDAEQDEHNLFTTEPWIFTWFRDQFERKWNNLTGVSETGPFAPSPPDQPSSPAPATGATAVPTDAPLRWHGGPYAYTYDVYLGTTNDPPRVAPNLPLGPSTSATHLQQYTPATALQPGTTYYWKVVGRTAANETATSPTWTFTTAGTAPPPPPPVTVVRGPYLQQVTSTAATLVWSTRDPGAGEVRAAGGGSTFTAAATSTRFTATATGMASDYYQHEARVTGLTPNTTYSYDILVGGVDANPQADTFTTAPAPGSGTVTFVAIGDSGVGSTEQRQIAALLDAQPFDLMLHGGDVAYGYADGGGAATHQTLHDWFFSIYGNTLRTRPVFPSMGNHDSRADNSWGRPYLDMFVLPRNGGSGSFADHAERYYSFDYGPLHVVVLDTELAFQDTTRRAAQLAWLDADLATTSQPWKVAVFHRSPFSAGGHHGSDLAVRSAFSPLFEEHGVQLVISAHEHTYERTRPWKITTDPANSPVTYIVSGGGGGPLYAAGTAEWTAVSASRHHYTRGTASACTLFLEAVGTDGSAFDSVTLSRCATTPDTQPPSVTITAPATGSTVQGNVTVNASASDNVGVSRTELVVNGTTVAQDTAAPYSFTWSSTSVPNGANQLVVRAVDLSGNSSLSGTVQVDVQNPVAGAGDIVLYAADATVIRGAWRREPDTTAAGGTAMHHPDAGVPKLSSALANPTHYFELTFTPEAGVAYRLWARIRAQNNYWANESVFVQFSPGSGSAYTIGTTAGAEINLEDCSGCGVAGWGWQDNAWGIGVEPNPIVFSTSAPVTLRVQTREDGTYIDQIYLKRVSPAVRPGALKNDSTIYPRTPGGSTPPPADTQAPTTAITAPAAGATVSGTVSVTASASDNVGVTRVEMLVDGAVAATLTSAPYAFSWNTTGLANGSHTLQSRAYDAAGLSGSSSLVSVTVSNGTTAPSEIVLYATDAAVVQGAWRRVTDATAAGGSAMHHPNAGVGKLTSALANPTHYFELTFTAQANVPYRLWARLRAENDAWNNESVFVQFSSGTAYTIGTTSGAEINLENCNACGVAGWGWQDNAWGVGVDPQPIVFSTGGVKTLRVQTREDGTFIDQIVLSPSLYLNTSPGALKNDTTILQRSSGGTPPPSDTQPPVTSITSPASGATVSGTVAVSAAASDNVGVTRVEILVDGTVAATLTSAPYTFSWNTTSVTNGSHTLQSRAYDAAGLSGSSSMVTVTVSNSAPGALPPPWVSGDIGSVGAVGGATASGGVFTVRGSGADIWDTADAFRYVSQPITGDVDIVARVTSVEHVHSWTKAGVMIRETLASSARHASMFVTPARGLAFQRRVATAGLSTNTGVAGTAPSWVKLERRGTTFTAYRSADGVSWTLVGSDVVPMGANAHVGLALTSHDNSRLATATFEQVTVTPR